jgi:alpha-beta hydrolase superfamily lysophospholipase
MISKRAKHWLRRATTITLAVIVLGTGAATWYQSEQIENDLLQVAPRQLEYDLEVIAAGRGLITLPAGPGTLAPGRWGLEWESGYAALGEIVSTAPGTVTRELLEVSGSLVAGTPVALDRFAFENGPSARGLEFEDVIIEGPLGNYPAWFTSGTDDTWVVLVHGRGSYRREALRLLPAPAGAGYPTLTITYRNDPPAPESPNRHYGLGESEWPDLEAAVRYALLEGARDVILVGYGVGAGITSTFMHESELAERAIGLILDSPLLVPAQRVDEAARAQDVPGFIVGWSKGLATLRFGTDWRGLDQVRRADEFTVPILVLYGTAESEGSLAAASAFAAARPDLVGLVRIPGAGPGEAWNFDAGRYEAAVERFLAEVAAGRSDLGKFDAE